MSLTIDITDILAPYETDAVPASSAVDGWLSAMWGIRPGTSLPATPVGVTSRYPAEIAEWLHCMWGVPLRAS